MATFAHCAPLLALVVTVGCQSDPSTLAPVQPVPEAASEASCQRTCEDRACGPDGCDGSCGACDPGFACSAGVCVAETTEAGVFDTGAEAEAHSEAGSACVPFDPAGKSWTLKPIADIKIAPIYPHIAIDPDNVPVAVFTLGKDEDTRYAAVSRLDATNWSPAEPVEVIDKSRLGKRPSIAIGAEGTLHVLGYDETGQRPRYSQKAPGGSWVHEPLYDPSADSGDSSSLVIDSEGTLRAAFLEYGTYRIIYGIKEPSGWVFEPITNQGADVVAGSSNLVVDAEGRPQLSLMLGKTDTNLGYAFKNHGVWTVETVDTTVDTGHYSSIALDSAGNPQILALRWPNAVAEARVARRVAGAWSVETIATGLGITYTTALAALCDTLFLAFARNEGTGTPGLWFGYRKPSDTQWTLQVVDSAVYVSGIDLAVGRDGRLHIIYLDETTYFLRHALLE